MKTLGILGIALLTAMTVGLGAQASKKGSSDKAASDDKAASEKAIIANEQKVNDAIVKGDAAAFKALVPNDSWSVDGNGAMSSADFQKNFKQFKLDPGSKITDTKVLWIASNSAVLIYKWTGKGTFMGQPIPPVVFASTIWHKSGSKWEAIFHQETTAAPGK